MLRFLHPRLHRSLPELDALGGGTDHARAAVRWTLGSPAAGRFGWARACWLIALLIGVFVAAAILCPLLYRSMDWSWGRPLDEMWDDIEYSWPPQTRWKHALIAAGGGLVAFIAAQRLLSRRSVRRVLRRRGLCDCCGYGLAGLPIDASGGVVCPECNGVSGVAPALGEPVTGVFVPNTGLKAKRFWTKRRLVRGAVGFAAVAVVVGGVWGGRAAVRHWQVMADAELAKADRVTLKEYRGVLPELFVPNGAPSATELFAAIKESTSLAEKKVRAELLNGDLSVYFDPTSTIKGDRETTAMDEANARFSMRVLDVWLADGGSAQLAALAGPLDYSRSPVVDAEGAITDFNLWNFTSSRHAWRICRAMAQRAWEAGDVAAWTAAARGQIATGRSTDQTPTMMSRLVSAAAESTLLAEIRSRLFELRARPIGDAGATAWLDAFDTVIAEVARTSSPLLTSVRGERLFTRHSIAALFADAAAVKDGRAEKAATTPALFSSDEREGRLGRYTENREALDEMFDRFESAAAKPRGERMPQAAAEKTGLAVIDALGPALEKFLRGEDQVAQLRIAVATMVALERQRRAAGAYPQTLDGLAMIAEVGAPLDVCRKNARLIYRPVTDGGGRLWYLLYSVGFDGEDNGGAPTEWFGEAFGSSLGKQKDAVYSDPKVK